MTVHFSLFGDRYVLSEVRARRGARWESVEHGRAAYVVRQWLHRAELWEIRRLVRSTCAALGTHAERSHLAEMVLRQLGFGLELQRQRAVGVAVWSEPSEVNEPAPPPEARHFAEVQFVFPDDTPVEGLAYVLIDPAGSRTSGTTGADGKVRKDPVRSGGYLCELARIEDVRWTTARAACFEEAELAIRTAGYVDGTSLDVHLYLEHRETEADRLTTLRATVEAGQARVPVRYDTLSGAIETDATDARVIAEVVATPHDWSKTVAPLEVELPTIVAVRTSSASATPGETIGVVIETRGFEDGTVVELAAHARRWLDDGAPEADLGRVTLEGGRAETSFRFDPPEPVHESEPPPPCYLVASIESPVARVGHSALITASGARRVA